MRLRSLSMPLTALALAVGVAGGTATVSNHAQAQGAKPDKKTRNAARTAYAAGEKAYKEGNYRAAVLSFKKANEAIPSPQATYWVAMSLDKQGSIQEAIETYEKLLADPGVSKIGDEKLGNAKSRLEALKSTPGKLSITTEPAGASVSVDGTPQMGETPMTVELSPGKHTIAVNAPGMNPAEFEVEAKPGGSDEESVELEAAPQEPEPAAAPLPEPEEPPPTESEPEKPPSKVPAYVTLGVAGVGAIVGTIFGVKALGAKSDFDDNPTSEKADDVERNALIADMAFGVAITLGVTGVVLLTTSGSEPETDAAPGGYRKLPERARLVVAPYASPHGGGAAAALTF